jgi:hypothetical protein
MRLHPRTGCWQGCQKPQNPLSNTISDQSWNGVCQTALSGTVLVRKEVFCVHEKGLLFTDAVKER